MVIILKKLSFVKKNVSFTGFENMFVEDFFDMLHMHNV